jgi:hypothetical protein
MYSRSGTAARAGSMRALGVTTPLHREGRFAKGQALQVRFSDVVSANPLADSTLLGKVY